MRTRFVPAPNLIKMPDIARGAVHASPLSAGEQARLMLAMSRAEVALLGSREAYVYQFEVALRQPTLADALTVAELDQRGVEEVGNGVPVAWAAAASRTRRTARG